MAAKPKAPKASKKNMPTVAKKAGKPVTSRKTVAAAAAAAGPSDAELDLRDRLKAAPRRPAGPPLGGDVPTRAAMAALADEKLPEPTDPKRR
jgi:hypothetical protein